MITFINQDTGEEIEYFENNNQYIQIGEIVNLNVSDKSFGNNIQMINNDYIITKVKNFFKKEYYEYNNKCNYYYEKYVYLKILKNNGNNL